MRRAALAWSLALSTAVLTPVVADAKPFVVFKDDGTMASGANDPGDAFTELNALYTASGQPLPEVISVWTTFPMLGNPFATYFVPRGNDVTGINVAKMKIATPPLRAVLLHNDVLQLDKRATLQRAPVDGFANYLFMLEFSHQWGPNVLVPKPNQNDLTGFPYHWSFFLESTSPAGGNHWVDNGDGSFTIVPRAPKDVHFTMLDLYLMGIAEPSEVGPIEVLTNTTVPPTPTDPLFGDPFSAQSFPWFDMTTAPLTVQATKRTLSIDDIVATNGPRTPAAVASRTWDVGFVLMVPADATQADIDAASAVFEPIVTGLPDVFAAATNDRGALHIVTDDTIVPGAGGAGGASSSSASTSTGGDNGEGGLMNTPLGRSSCSCTVVDDDRSSSLGALACVLGAGAWAARRRAHGRRDRVYNSSP